jgi:N-methylhydantoinase A
MREAASGLLCGVDTGGTFTDCVAIDEAGRLWTAKVPSTPPDFERGFFEGIDLLAAQMGLSPEGFLGAAGQVVHGTTVATNALLERRGATVGLLATSGHRDAIFVMRGVGRVTGLAPDEAMRTLRTSKPPPLVEKGRAVEVVERVDWNGDVVVRLDEEQARKAIGELVAAGVEAIAVALLWAFRNPEHEQRLAALINEIAPSIPVTQAHAIAPRTGEYERTAAAVIDAYVKPATVGYLRKVERRCHELGYRGPLLVMQCDGNVAPVSALTSAPVLTIQSGPAAGLEASRVLGVTAGWRNVIAVDMGGTSCDVGLVSDGKALRRTTSTVSQYEYFTPSIEIESIGVGGGSIAWVDARSGALKVGPRSAGALPGPACYGRRGTEATVTDADLALGRLNPHYFLGGRMRLDEQSATLAIDRIAARLGLDGPELAAGISHLAELQIAEEIRKLTVARGYDPRDFVIFAYGGAGPVHATAVARDLGIATVVVPLGDVSSLWSAFGAATTDLGATVERSLNLSEPFDHRRLARELEAIRRQAERVLAASSPTTKRVFRYSAGLRYRAQVNEVWVDFDGELATNSQLERLVGRFENEYEALFGKGTGYRQAGIELAALRCVATIQRLPESARRFAAVGAAEESRAPGTRAVYWEEFHDYHDTPVIGARHLQEHGAIDGPAIIELADTTVAVHPGQRASVDAHGDIIVRIGTTRPPRRGASKQPQRAGVGGST